jgi:hypothetical protein
MKFVNRGDSSFFIRRTQNDKGDRSMELYPLPNRLVEDWSLVYRKSLW